ncbi:MAG: hypothetical protein GVY29_09375 [Spirochaetes bacterium]|nr:hypothetical protein [Spirochaetota bacterium]
MQSDESTRVTFFAGLTTIGGVHVLIRSKNHGLLFDFGVPGNRDDLFSPRFALSAGQTLAAFLHTGMAPPLLDAYDPALLEYVSPSVVESVWSRRGVLWEEVENTEHLMVFVSHIHQDHMTLLPYAREGLPVYMHPDAAAIYECVERAGEYAGTRADIRPLSHEESVSHGPISLTLLEVDHDTPGASGFIAETEDYRIAFTGDWRGHGRHPERMKSFASRCRERDVSMLITETTMLSFGSSMRSRPVVSESEAVTAMENTIASARSLVYVNILARNLERFADLIAACVRQGRYLVADENTAEFWRHGRQTMPEALSNRPDFDLLTERAASTLRLLPSLGSGEQTAAREAYTHTSPAEVAATPAQFVYYLPYAETPRMAETEQLIATARSEERAPEEEAQSVYFHADGDPLTSEDKVLNSWLRRYGVRYIHSFTGGHATQQRIEELIRDAAPHVVVPVHGRQPSLLRTNGVSRYVPQPGETLDISTVLTRITQEGR